MVILFFYVPYTDDAAIENIITCLVHCFTWVSEFVYTNRLPKVDAIAMRLELKHGSIIVRYQ